MSNTKYKHEWYLKNKERILAKNLAYDRRWPEKRKLRARSNYQQHKLHYRLKGRLKNIMQLTTMNNEKGRRIALYLKHKEYFDDRIMQDPQWKQRKGPVALAYINSKRTLRDVGVEYHINNTRVQQIVSEFLYKIVRIYEKNKKVLDTISIPLLREPAIEENKLYTLEQENKELKEKLQQIINIISPIGVANVPIKSIPILEPIVDDGDTGYLLSNVKQYLQNDYQKFSHWYQEKHYTGGIYEGEYYFLAKYVDEFLQSQQSVTPQIVL